MIRASGVPAARATDRLIDRRLTQEQLREQAQTDGIVAERRSSSSVANLSTLPDRALSLSWPWPHFMLVTPEPWRKKVENRKPGFSHKSFRGECWAHCTPCKSRRDYDWACVFALQHGVPAGLLPMQESPWIGHIVGRWNVLDRLPPPSAVELPDRWRMDGQFGFLVEDARPVTPVRCKGSLGFWRVPGDVLVELGRTP